MKKILIRLRNAFKIIGYDPFVTVTAFRGLFSYIRDYLRFKKQLKNDTAFPFDAFYPIFKDRSTPAGVMNGHYFHQDLLVAQRIFLNNPQKHVDIGSRIDGFVAHIAAFRKIEVIDIRHQEIQIPNVTFRQADMMRLPYGLMQYCDSLSSLHVIEHFGLGRYGDPIDAYGHLKGLASIYAMLQKGGTFYFSVPIGPQRIVFNAHRIFSLRYLLATLTPQYAIRAFSFVDDSGRLHANISLCDDLILNNCHCRYGCGIFELTKL